MPLFPEIDVSQLAERNAAGLNGSFGANDPVGVMAGLNSSLLALLANFSPGELGVCVVDERLQLTLPIPRWAEWTWVESATSASQTAGGTPTIVAFTVPADERAELLAVRIERASGDNTVRNISVDFPALYSSGSAVVNMQIMAPDSAGANVHWPDPHPDVTSYVNPPIPLEPLSLVKFQLEGDGVSASTFLWRVLMSRTKIHRALVP